MSDTFPDPFAPYMPDFNQIMPEWAFDNQTSAYGIRLGWMKAHSCPCAYSGPTPGSPNPRCITCDGRGVYWDKPYVLFNGELTFMHTSSAPDEPGAHADPDAGNVFRAEPTITIPRGGPNSEATVWQQASTFDAYIVLDSPVRFNSTLISGSKETLPYQQGATVETVTAYSLATLQTVPVPASQYVVTGGLVQLTDVWATGTSYTVEYTALPVYVAYRKAGGLPHVRPFGLGSQNVPKRFRVVNLDLWTRTRRPGDGPNSL